MKVPTPPILDVAPMATPVTVVGDVHLCTEEPEVVRHFVSYVDRVAERGGTLVILGDLFDFWYGAPQREEPLPRFVFERLAKAQSRGLDIAFVPGNRDFMLGRGGELDFDVWPDPVRATWGERRVLLTHGDLLCVGDTSYQRMRRVMRRPDGRPRDWTVLLPSSVRRKIAFGLRSASSRATAKKTMASMDIDYGAAREWLDRYDVDAIVAGHVHTGVHHRLAGENGSPDRDIYVLKDWERGGGVVLFDDRGIRLVTPERD